MFLATDASGDAIFSDTWNYRIETFPVTRELLSPLVLVFLILPGICRAARGKLHPRLFSPRESPASRATAACGNNFRDFPAVARALCREAINFFPPIPQSRRTAFSLLSSRSLSIVRPGNLVGRSVALLVRLRSSTIPPPQLRPAMKQIFSFTPLEGSFTYTKEDAQSCRQSRNFLKVPCIRNARQDFSLFRIELLYLDIRMYRITF